MDSLPPSPLPENTHSAVMVASVGLTRTIGSGMGFFLVGFEKTTTYSSLQGRGHRSC